MLSRFLLLASLLVSSCPLVAGVAEPAIEGAWVRALPPVQQTTAAYFSLVNSTGATLELTGATVEGAGRVEIHTSRTVDGLVRMEQLATLKVGPGERLVLEPGATHLMVFDLDAMPRPGEQRQLCLEFSGREPLCTAADVRKSAASGGHHHH